MEILNETVYATEDIRALFEQIAEITDNQGRMPKKLRIGYYSPTPKDKLVPQSQKRRDWIQPSPYKFINFNIKQRCNWRKVPRLGLVRPSKLHDSPLEQLASVADDEMVIPAQAVRELVIAFSRWFGRYYFHAEDSNGVIQLNLVELKEDLSGLLGFKIRYTLRAKRGSRKEALASKDDELIESLERKISSSQRWTRKMRAKIRQNEAACEKQIERYRALCKKQGKYSYH